MPARKTIALAVGGAALVAAAGAATAASLGDDPGDAVEAIEVGRLTDAPDATAAADTPTTTGADVAVPGLTELSGPVTQATDDDGFDDLVVEGLELDFGPDEWSATVGPTQDFDDDGRAEALRDEIAGLRGTDSTFAVRLDDSGDEAEVYLVNGLTYRDPAGAAPWGDDDGGSGDGGSGDDGSTPAADDSGDDDSDDTGGSGGSGDDSGGDDNGGEADRDDRDEAGDDRD